MSKDPPQNHSLVLSVTLPGLMLGIGLGGFFDGIFLHQIFQWHHMFSSIYSVDTVSGLQMNTLGDGLFHLVTWLAVLVGLYVLYSRVAAGRRRAWGSQVLWGWIFAGWGWFNLVEGLVDHQILGIHHVRTGPNHLWWDMGFLGVGIVLIGVGTVVARRAAPITINVDRTAAASAQGRQ